MRLSCCVQLKQVEADHLKSKAIWCAVLYISVCVKWRDTSRTVQRIITLEGVVRRASVCVCHSGGKLLFDKTSRSSAFPKQDKSHTNQFLLPSKMKNKLGKRNTKYKTNKNRVHVTIRSHRMHFLNLCLFVYWYTQAGLNSMNVTFSRWGIWSRLLPWVDSKCKSSFNVNGSTKFDSESKCESHCKWSTLRDYHRKPFWAGSDCEFGPWWTWGL